MYFRLIVHTTRSKFRKIITFSIFVWNWLNLQMHLLYLAIQIVLVTSVSCLLPPDDNNCNAQCFHQPPEGCPPPEKTCRCRLVPNCQKAAICCNVNHFTLREGLACASKFYAFHLVLFKLFWNLKFVLLITLIYISMW